MCRKQKDDKEMADSTTDFDPLIDGFFKALNQLHFNQAATLLSAMRSKVLEWPPYALWALYLSGVLAQEQDRDWATAEERFQQVLTANPPDELRADVYLSLAIAYENQARWRESIAISEAGITIWQKLGRAIKTTMLRRQVAIVCYRGFEAGDLDAAWLDLACAKCEEALHILESYQPTIDPQGLYRVDHQLYQAITYQVLGCVYTCMGDYQLAQSTYQNFLELSIVRGDQFHIGCASWYLADVLQLGNHADVERTISLYDDALVMFRQKGEILFQAHLLASQGSLYRKHNQSHRAVGCYQQSIQLLETIRTQISSEEARRGFFSTVVNIHDNSLLAELYCSHDENTEGKNLANAFGCAEMARSRVILDQLIGPLPDHAKNVAATIPVEELQMLLGEEDLLIEFHCTGLLTEYRGHSTEQEAANNVLYPPPKTLIFVLDHKSLSYVDAGISPNTLFMRDLWENGAHAFSVPSLCRAMYNKLIQPIADRFQNKRRLYIIPHGPLHYIPFHALIAPDGETLLRDDGPEIVYAPSATILFRELDARPTPASASCLAVGYNGDIGMELSFAEAEATYIAEMVTGDALVGSSPKKEQLYTQAAAYRTLHFSCHGEFDPDKPLESLLHIGPNETLTGQEIMDNLHLNCNLVTLSACESGLSKVQRGDELYGLIRAFLYAGAPAILATLWRVDERITLIFAEKFYELLQQGISYATALKTVQLYLKQLTRREAVAILTRHVEPNEKAGQQRATGKVAITTHTEQNNTILHGSATEETLADNSQPNALPAVQLSAVQLPGVDDDELIFADPQFWAPFILIGDPQIYL